jgi:hypothetical protein
VSVDKNRKSLFFTPAGAGIAIISFFLPWVKLSCGGVTRSFTGADIGGYVWIVFASAITICAAFILFLLAGKVRWSIPVTFTGAVAAYATILFRLMEARKDEIEFLDIKLTLLYGGILTLLGFLVAVIGAFSLRRKE